MAKGMLQAVEHLLSRYKDLSSKHSPTKKPTTNQPNKNPQQQLVVVEHICNFSTWEMEAGGSLNLRPA
jgi:hypothetical protein